MSSWSDCSLLDLAAIRKLLESESTAGTCPSCNMPFDKGKKRKLIDTCGHERCYSCMFRNEACPLCSAEDTVMPAKKVSGSTLGTDQLIPDSKLGTGSRSQVKTNGHFTTYMQARQEGAQDWGVSPCRLPKPSRGEGCCSPANPMSQSCPTPPQNRKKFFLSPKSLRSSWGLRGSSRVPADNALSAMMSISASSGFPENRRWSSVVLSKIKSLWFAGGTNGIGLNQFSDDEGGTIKPVCQPPKKSSQSDLYMRLGLLLGDNARRSQRSRSTNRSSRSHDSISSLASLEANTLASTNTSPVSTLTGSSEADAHHRTLKEPSSDSVGSLMSMSGHSNCSSSPLSRRHSVTTSQPGQVEELNVFKNRRQSIRRSARSGSVKGPIDPKVRFAQYRTQQLTLKPLFFEVPLQEPDPLFVGRHWVIKQLEECLGGPGAGALITGLPGTGKTALLLQLVEYSCFGRRREPTYKQDLYTCNGKDRPSPQSGSQSIYCQINLVSERIKHLASHVVAYHFCQADNNSTCLVPDFIHSVAAQLCQAPQLTAYKEHLQNEPHLQVILSMKECIAAPDVAFKHGILEPLCSLRRVGKITPSHRAVILVDALCEAEYHRPDTGDTIASFISRHAPSCPSWIKFILTVRTHLDEVMPPLPFQRISLDMCSENTENLQKDLLDYINFRVSNSPSIQSNVVAGAAGQFRFCQHLLGLAQGSFLFAKLTLDLLERGHLVAKSASYKVLPVSLAQIYLLHFNLRFPTVKSFEKVSSILSVCLAALFPLTLLEIYYSVNALCTENFLSWEEFLQRFKNLSGLLVKRLDNTYMFFHPSFREWLIRRDENESNKFICDLRAGHAGIAFRLSRLQVPLDAEKALELGHHILKAHLYKNMTLHKYSSRDLQAHWIASVSFSVSDALCSLRNIYSPNVKVSRLLLLSGANPDHVTEFLGQAPALCLFAHEGCVEMTSLLLEFGASLDSANNQGCTALGLAASRGHTEIVRILVGAGASLGRTDTAGRCPLVHAARNGHLNVVAYLLACDWVLDNPGPNQEVSLAEAAQQALIAASAQGHLEIVEYLLDMAEVKADGHDTLTGETALTVAASNGCHTIVTALINRGANIATVNHKDLSPLLLGVREGHWAVAERLLQHHAPLDQTDPQGRTPLMMAAAEGHVGLIELLLDKGSDMSKQDSEGLTALGWACIRGRAQAAQVLLDRGAEINQADKTGRIPLDLAAVQGNPTLVQMLMERGAMLEHVDVTGLRPLDRAIACRNVPVVQCFLRRGAKLGPTTWTMAAGKTDIILVLLNKLLEDGNVLYRKSRLKEAAHRYQYALNKFPPAETLDSTFHQLRINFLLNYSRCKRKMNEPEEAVELATQVLKQKSDSYEAFYARAKARIDLKMYEDALTDVQEALLLLPPQNSNRDVRRVLLNLRDEVRAGTMTASLDTLCQTETSL
ncbi:zinc-RING finger and ankyrin repeat domain-containing protein rolling pebbles isoform X4 [Lycorma delicatula]|uniref:zinc-RING finger and ankyrin repeat domain-containing protein rolling pebbles isoform X4 n=1 Tax=Lycorma delicatula TaxID=130591 RepID=UPI003F518B9D